MITTLVKYLGMLAIGAVLGYNDKVNGKIADNLNIIQTAGLLFLLFIMGITIGMNKDIITNIWTIGIKAAVITIFTISFSILGLRLIRNLVIKEEEVNEP